MKNYNNIPAEQLEQLEPLLETLRASGFERITKKIELTWGSKECEDYLKSLVIDDRGGRQGFDPTVLLTILKIDKIHASYFDFSNPNDVWSITYKK